MRGGDGVFLGTCNVLFLYLGGYLRRCLFCNISLNGTSCFFAPFRMYTVLNSKWDKML